MKNGFYRLIALLLCAVVLLGLGSPAAAASQAVPSLTGLSADKAMYAPGETATFTVDIDNSGGEAWNGTLHFQIYHLENAVAALDVPVSVPADAKTTCTAQWVLPGQDFTGYLVKAYFNEETWATTGLDCSSDFTVFPRYGYVSDYTADTAQAQAEIRALSDRYHINAYQLYDWMWRHETLIQRSGTEAADSWQDLFGRTISVQTIRDYISAIHSRNGAAMAYVMSYAAREGYTDKGIDPSAGLFTDQGHESQLNVDFGDGATYLWLFDPANEIWQQTMTAQYTDAVNTLGFDGLQIDQMGQRNNVYDYRGQKVYLEDTFSDFVNAAKVALTANNAEKDAVTFNIVDGTVNGWAMDDVTRNADTDFNFSEIWWLSNSYNDIKNYIEQVRSQSGGKALVLAAYMNYNDNCGTVYEAENAALDGTSVNTDHTGYTGSGFVDGFAEAGDSVTFTVTAPEDGLYAFVFRYANAGSGATRKVYVDGTILDQVSFKTLSSWDDWAQDANCSTYLTAGTHTVRLSYDTGCAGAINLDSLTLGTFDAHSVRLADAAFAASGAYHIELGAGQGQGTMLSHEYYPMNAKVMDSALQGAMERHYDFITAYENLLYAPEIAYADTGTQYLTIANEAVSGSGEAGKIWYIARQREDYSILHLINLTGEDDTQWRNATAAPATKENLAVRYYLGENAAVSGVYLASPDRDGCQSTSLSYTTGADEKGSYVAFTVPSLEYWDMIYIRRSNGSDTVFEAENALKTGVAVDTDHAGYTGTGFVDQFAEQGDSVGFTVSVPEDGAYTLRLRYANGSGSEAARSVIVDGTYANKAYFVAQSDWDTWATAEVGIDLPAGVHTVVLYYGDYEYGAINLDSMELTSRSETTRSLYLNNWKNLVAIWQDAFVNQATAVNADGPGLYELRYYDGTASGNYNTNLIRNYSTFLRDETAQVSYTTGSKFSSSGYFDQGGVLVNTYRSYDGAALPVTLSKQYAFVPNEQFLVVRYDLTNPGDSARTVDLLDMLHIRNETGANVSAAYSAGDHTVRYDLSGAGLPYLAHGVLSTEALSGYQVADDTQSTGTAGSPWHSFNANGSLNGNGSVTCADISSGLSAAVTLAPGQTQTLYFYVAAAGTEDALNAAIAKVTNASGDHWMETTRSAYAAWLAEGRTPELGEDKLNDAYKSISVFMKQSIVPGTNADGNVRFAAFPATTNPSAYSYKVWARDSAVTAMGLDATGHLREAENYWTWLADRQITTDEGSWKKPGTFWTCYWVWDNGPVSFVEPEFDSIGMFLVGAYRHYEQLTGSAKTAFLEKIWPAYRRSADYVLNNITDAGFGPADCSIWEEQNEYNAFTQALYVAGLDAAQHMAAAKGLQEVADLYNGGASTIRTAILRDDTASPKGLWNTESQRFNRAVNLDGTANTTYDSSSDVLISYGVVDAESSRAKSHIDGILENLGHDTYGVARYENDGFYHRMPWDPGGNEAYEDEPSWPQMAMWIAMYELQSGYKAYRTNAYRRLQWFVDRTAEGYMPQGECFSNITRKPHLSTMCEPITGAAYLMAALAYDGQFDMRIYGPQVNAGAYRAVTMHDGCVGDWTQWAGVPYYTDPVGDASGSYDLKRVYLANDGGNVYLRLDLDGWTLPGYQAEEVFAVQIYADGGTGTAMTTTMTGGEMTHSMRSMVMRSSDSGDYCRYTAGSDGWTLAGTVESVLAPQWEVNSGRMELAIPFASLGNGALAAGDWTNLHIVLLQKNGADWVEADAFDAHYRITADGSEWLKGNFQ